MNIDKALQVLEREKLGCMVVASHDTAERYAAFYEAVAEVIREATPEHKSYCYDIPDSTFMNLVRAVEGLE